MAAGHELQEAWTGSIKPALLAFVKGASQGREKAAFAGYLDAIETMDRTALGPAMVDLMVRGKLVGEKTLFAKLQTELKGGVVTADELKHALRAFDGLAQRFAAANPEQVKYPTDPSNRARNYLQALASALHR